MAWSLHEWIVHPAVAERLSVNVFDMPISEDNVPAPISVASATMPATMAIEKHVCANGVS
jgi:hypothetical protein